MSNKKTILLYTDESTAGGVARYNHVLVPALLAAGWRTFSAQPPNASPMLAEERELGVQQRFLSYDPVTAFGRSFTDTADPERIMTEVMPDLVYFSDCCPLSNIAAKHVAITRKIPFAVISHSAADCLAQRFPACVPIAKRQLELARDVITISQKNLDILRTHFGLAPNKGKVVLNGRPAAFFYPIDPLVRRRIRAELKIPEEGVLCFTSARFDTAKGYQHQLAAIRQLQTRNALGKLYFAWAGIGERQAEFAQSIKAAGLDSRIRLLGQRWDIAALLDASDLFVLTTMLEGGLPLSVMEAMAKGVATIVTSVSGVAGVANGACQLLPDPNTQPNDTACALADALDTLASDPVQRAKLSQTGRALAERSFRQETNLTQTLAILESGTRPDTAPPVFSEAKPAPRTPSEPERKEAFLLKPDLTGSEWRKIILVYLHAFLPGDPVGLIIQCDDAPGKALPAASFQEQVLDVVRCSGKESFADIHLIANPRDLVATLRNFQLIHRLPFTEESASPRTSAVDLFKSALAAEPQTRGLTASAPAAFPIAPPPAARSSVPRRLLTIIEYSVQPYNIGDFLIYLMGTIVAAEMEGAEKVDLCIISDPSQPHPEPIMRKRINAQNHYAYLMSFLPLVELHPRFGSLFVFDSVPAMHDFLRKSSGYRLWPSAADVSARKYMYYDTLKLLNLHHQQKGEIPRFQYLPALHDWTRSFFQTHTPNAVPVTINLRNNPNFHGHRNYVPEAWQGFFERCQNRFPVKFIITCAASEVDPGLRKLANVVFAKDHQSTLLQDLALINFSAFHLGSPSGPSILPAFGTRPYHVVNSDATPYLDHYGGAMVLNDAGELQFAFASPLQTFGVAPETAVGLWQQFEKIWNSQDWAGAWRLDAAAANLATSATPLLA
jgi:glycosyltransferase involved in cell wall biosynthesis